MIRTFADVISNGGDNPSFSNKQPEAVPFKVTKSNKERFNKEKWVPVSGIYEENLFMTNPKGPLWGPKTQIRIRRIRDMILNYTLVLILISIMIIVAMK